MGLLRGQMQLFKHLALEQMCYVQKWMNTGITGILFKLYCCAQRQTGNRKTDLKMISIWIKIYEKKRILIVMFSVSF
jgi:hypothetical protein